jgi:hypothetical protein
MAPVRAWCRLVAVVTVFMCVPVEVVAQPPLPVGFRLLVPGDSVPPWAYPVIPYSWWDQIGAYDKFLECESVKQGIREYAKSRPDENQRSGRPWVRDNDGKLMREPASAPGSLERGKTVGASEMESPVARWKREQGMVSRVKADISGPLAGFDYRRLAAAECVSVR